MLKFVKVNLLFAFLAATVFVIAQSARSFSSPVVAASAENFAAAPSAKKLYQANCARCHGADGRGDTEAGRLYDVPSITGASNRKRIETVIKNGADSMPAFGKKLTKAQISSIAEYVRAL